MPRHKHSLSTCWDKHGNLICGKLAKPLDAAQPRPEAAPQSALLRWRRDIFGSWRQCEKRHFGRRCSLSVGHKGKHKL